MERLIVSQNNLGFHQILEMKIAQQVLFENCSL